MQFLPDCEVRVLARNARPSAVGVKMSQYDLEQLIAQKTRLTGAPLRVCAPESHAVPSAAGGRGSSATTAADACFATQAARQQCCAALHGFKTSYNDTPFEFECVCVEHDRAALHSALLANAALFNRLAPGRRTDTLVLRSVPPRWFGITDADTSHVLGALPSLLLELFELGCAWSAEQTRANVKRVCASPAERADGGSLCDLYIQFSALDAVRQAIDGIAHRLLKQTAGGFVIRLRADVDHSAHLADTSIAARTRAREQQLVAAERKRVEAERRRVAEEKRRADEERARSEREAREAAERAALEAAALATALAEQQRLHAEAEERARIKAERAALLHAAKEAERVAREEAAREEARRAEEEARTAAAAAAERAAQAEAEQRARQAAEMQRLRAEALASIARLEAQRAAVAAQLAAKQADRERRIRDSARDEQRSSTSDRDTQKADAERALRERALASMRQRAGNQAAPTPSSATASAICRGDRDHERRDRSHDRSERRRLHSRSRSPRRR